MRVFRGSVVSEGITTGPAYFVSSGEVRIREGSISEAQVSRECLRLDRAVVAVRRDLVVLEEATRSKLGDMTKVVSSLQSFLDDEVAVIGPIRRLIQVDHLDAATAVTRRFSQLVAQFKALPEPLPSRVPDLVDVERRLVSQLLGRKWNANLDRLPRKVILVAEDLTPTQTASLDRDRVLAFVTDRGGPGSHTAILARHLGIPAVVGLGNLMQFVSQGDSLIVDALKGEVTLDPDPDILRAARARSRAEQKNATLYRVDSAPPFTRDRTRIMLQGNIDTGAGARQLAEMGVEGVGLFRTEYLYLGREDAPDEEAQVEHYRTLFEAMAPHTVTVRTFDFGADKFEQRLGMAPEPNPFLGLRSLRLCFERAELFRSQLRALMRASVVGNCRIMFPMVSDLRDFRRAKGMLEDVRTELSAAGIPFAPNVPIGAMVEVPAAALTAPNLLREADFLSIGTNDLTQYTLAVDRTNSHVADLFQPHHPAVLRLIKMTVDAAARAGKPVSACGEMAGNARYVPVLLGLGVLTLSMSATRIHDVAKRIRSVRLDDCEELALAMVTSDDAVESAQHLDWFLDRLPSGAIRRRRD